MKKLTERELERLLAAPVAGEPSPDPPAGLAERIKAEIPADLPVPDLDFESPSRPVWTAPRWRLAAALAMTLGGGSLAWWVWQDAPRLQQAPEPASASAPASVESTMEPVGSTVVRDSAAAAQTPADRRSESLADRLAVLEPEPARPRTQAEEAAAPPALGYFARTDQEAGAGGRAAGGARQEVAEPRASQLKLEKSDRDAANEPVGVGGEANIALRGASPRVEGSAQAGPVSTPEAREKMRRRLRQLPSGMPESKKVPLPDPTPAESRERAARRFEGEREEKIEVVPTEDLYVVEGLDTTDPDFARLEPVEEVAPPAAPAPVPEPPPAAPSTGGTVEPNDQAYGDVFFEHAGVNPFLDTEEDALSTFGLDVDTGSWGVVRRYLDDGHLPPRAAVRVEEIVNALDYGDPAPRRGDFALHAEGAPTPFAESDRYRLLRFAVKAREISVADRRPAALTFVVDVSGSMAQEDRLGLVKRSLTLLVERLRRDDRLGLVIYGSRGQIVLEATSDHAAILAAIDRLVPGGSTNAEEGLVLGYQVASRALRPGAINRVILCSDGVANVGRTGPDSILTRIEAEAARGIELTTLGFGMGNYNDVLMERLADAGDGRYAYLDSVDEARRILVEQLTGTLETVAGEARAQVEFNPEVVERYRLLGYENRDIADERFRDDTVDAGEIGAGHTVTALYEIKLREGLEAPAGARAFRNEPVATLRLRWRSVASGEFVESEEVLRLRDLAESWDGASPALRLASLAAELAEILRGSYWAREGSLDDVFRRLQRLAPEFSGNRQAAELTALAGQAAELAQPKEPAAD